MKQEKERSSYCWDIFVGRGDYNGLDNYIRL